MTNNLFKKLLTLVVFGLQLNVFAQPMIKLISPTTNQEWEANTSQGISWIYSDLDSINILYSFDKSIWAEIYTDISPEIGVVGWNVPNIPGKTIFIKIEDVKKRVFSISSEIKIVQKNYLNKSTAKENQIVIMPLGNSITYDNRASYNGISPDPRPVGDRTGYRYPLYNLLTNAGFDFIFTGSEHAGGNYLPAGYDANAGFSGIRDDQLAKLLKTGRLTMEQYGVDRQVTPGPYLDVYPADIILLHIGTNGTNSAGGTDPSDIEEILDEIKRYEDSTGTVITVVLAKIIDRAPTESYVTTFNNNIEAMALDRVNNPANDAYPDNIVIVDMQNGAGLNYVISEDPNGSPGDMNDALHPNDNGYAKMAQVWLNAIADIVPSKPAIISQPQNAFVVEGDDVNFSITATGNEPLNYQWKKNGVDISGANSPVLMLSEVSVTDDSSIIQCSVSNGVGTIESDIAYLYVTSENERVLAGLELFYDFNEGSGVQISDNSSDGTPVNLEIQDENKIQWIPFGLSINEKVETFSTLTPQDLFNKVIANNEIGIELWIRPHQLLQSGPARIFTISSDGSNRNITIGQREDRYVVRLRTTSTDLNGLPELSTSNSVVDTQLTHLFFTKDSNGTAKLYVNGAPRIIDTREGDFSGWDNSYKIGIGNEFNSLDVDRFWLGDFYLAGVYSRALSESEILHNYLIGFEGKDKLLIPPSELTGTVENESWVNLNWNDNEVKELGYIIERKANSVDSSYIVIDSVGADVTTYIDMHDKYVTSYLYRVKAYGNISGSDYSNVVQVDNIVTKVDYLMISNSYQLYQNYPNPFNPVTNIRFYIPYQSKVTLQIYNPLGELVMNVLNDEIKNVGLHSINIHINNFNSGVYYYRIKAHNINGQEKFIKTNKFILLK